jgi:excisionase family DNA binding protein
MQTMSSVRHLTVSEIALREHISIDTVKRAIKYGHLPAHRVGSRGDWRIKVEDYERWIANGAPTKQEPTDGE